MLNHLTARLILFSKHVCECIRMCCGSSYSLIQITMHKRDSTTTSTKMTLNFIGLTIHVFRWIHNYYSNLSFNLFTSQSCTKSIKLYVFKFVFYLLVSVLINTLSSCGLILKMRQTSVNLKGCLVSYF